MPPPIAALLTAARAIAQPPRGITANPAALARFPAHDRRVLEARDLHDAVDATFGQDSDDDNEEPPPPFRGSFTDWEDAKYLELLIRYGQPKNENPPAMQKFLEEFGCEASSIDRHRRQKVCGYDSGEASFPQGGGVAARCRCSRLGEVGIRWQRGCAGVVAHRTAIGLASRCGRQPDCQSR